MPVYARVRVGVVVESAHLGNAGLPLPGSVESTGQVAGRCVFPGQGCYIASLTHFIGENAVLRQEAKLRAPQVLNGDAIREGPHQLNCHKTDDMVLQLLSAGCKVLSADGLDELLTQTGGLREFFDGAVGDVDEGLQILLGGNGVGVARIHELLGGGELLHYLDNSSYPW